MAKHTLHFAGKGGSGVDPSHGPLLRDILDIVVDGCQQATRLRLEGRSTAPGTVPAWLERAASFEIVKIRPGELVMKSQPLIKAHRTASANSSCSPRSTVRGQPR